MAYVLNTNKYIDLYEGLKIIFPKSEVCYSKESPQLIQIHSLTSIDLIHLIDRIKEFHLITLHVMKHRDGITTTLIVK